MWRQWLRKTFRIPGNKQQHAPEYYEKHNQPRIESPGLASLSESQLSLLTSILRSDVLPNAEAIYLLAVIEGVKPGASIPDLDVFYDQYSVPDHTFKWVQNRPLYRLLSNLSLPFQVGYKYSEKAETQHLLFNIAGTSADLTFAPVPLSASKTDPSYRYAKFLGVPDSDILWWEDWPEGKQAIKKVQPVDEWAGVQLTPTERQYVRLLPYVPSPTEEGIKRAIELGKGFYAAAAAFDNLSGEEIAVPRTKEVEQRSVGWYRDE